MQEVAKEIILPLHKSAEPRASSFSFADKNYNKQPIFFTFYSPLIPPSEAENVWKKKSQKKAIP
ncbi:MAG: hypothetical protein QP800_13715 [Enterococcus faecalis]|nr:hypothetical protein [Enterococcus faecalis]MDK8292895.1 hypothetical protein [Enterococcus faecalis]